MTVFKVAIIDPVGGHADNYYNYGLSIGLARNNVEVFYFTSNSTELIEYPNVHTLFSFGNIWKQKNKYAKARKYISGIHKALRYARKEQKIELVHFLVFRIDWLLYFSLMLAKIRGFKTVVTLHDVNSFTGAKINAKFEQQALKMMDQAIVHNQHSLTEVNKLLPSGHYNVIHHGHYADFIKKVEPQQKSDILNLLFFGQIKTVKGLDLLIKALELLKARRIKVKLVIAGKVWKDDFSKYQQQIDEAGVGDMIEKHIKYIPNDKVWNYFNEANVVVLPYREIYQSGVLLMAMSYGRAVLTSDIRAFADLIVDGQNGFLFKAENAGSLAEKIEYISLQKELLGKIEDRAHKIILRDYNWEDSAQKVKQVYLQLVPQFAL